MATLTVFAHGSWETVAIVLTLEGLPWVLSLVSLWRGLARKRPRWIGGVVGALASSLAVALLWLTSPIDWSSRLTYFISAPIALGAIGLWLNRRSSADKA